MIRREGTCHILVQKLVRIIDITANHITYLLLCRVIETYFKTFG